MIKHPAKYTDSFIPIFAAYLNERNENDELKYSRVLDPFGGTGKIGEIADYGYQGLICCSEIEREWAEISAANPKVHFTSCGDSSDMEWAEDWKTIVDIFDTIDRLKKSFESLDVTYLREVQQKILILNLEKYAWSLQNYIVEKYSRE